jgi:hypothetical protein
MRSKPDLDRRRVLAGMVGASLTFPAMAALQGSDRQLAQAIRADARLDKILAAARALLATGLTAGTDYPEVWIRDLNTFIEVGLEVQAASIYREALRRFFLLQGPGGDILDGYAPESDRIERDYRTSPELPGLLGHKNSVEVDQESSLIQAVARYVRVSGDRSLLSEVVDGERVDRRLERALEWVMRERWSERYGLVWAATKIDWGDVQPENNPGARIDEMTHPAIGIYDNAFFVIAVDELLGLSVLDKPAVARWTTIRDRTRENIRRHLWRGPRRGPLPHIYLDKGSPFPAWFDESPIYYHGGVATAIEAGVLKRDEIRPTLAQVEANVKAAGAATIGLTVYPAYPSGLFLNPNVRTAYTYQNGGDWDWFGARWVRELVRLGHVADAYRVFGPMLDRSLAHGGFFEWWTLDNQPKGSGQFRGAAGVMATAALSLRAWAANR